MFLSKKMKRKKWVARDIGGVGEGVTVKCSMEKRTVVREKNDY